MAFGSGTFSNASGAVNDLFGAFSDIEAGDAKADALRLKAKGDLAEASNYDLASGLAKQNEAYTVGSTQLQLAQQQRSQYLQTGSQSAAIAGAGFANTGSALDILRDSAMQGSIAKSVLTQQGYITEQGYEEQAKSYQTMSAAAREAAAEEQNMASKAEDAGTFGAIGKGIGAAFNIGAALFAL